MRHRIHHKKLNRTMAHRWALRRNLAQSLIEHGRVTTTLAKAKDVQPFFERLVTLAVKVRTLAGSDPAASLRARRRIDKVLGDRGMIPSEYRAAYEEMSDAARAKTMRMASGRRHRTGEPRGRLTFTAESVMHRLLHTVAPGVEGRSGGYTRLIRLARRRKGDDAPCAMLQLLGDEERPTSLTKPKKSARARRADARYAFAIKEAKKRGRRSGPQASSERQDSQEAVDPEANGQVESAPEAKSGETPSAE